MDITHALAELSRLYLGLVMGAACVAKAKGFSVFSRGLTQWGVSRPTLRVGLAALICCTEGALSALLLLSQLAEFAAWATLAFIAVGVIAVARALAQRSRVVCHCFGSSGEPVTAITLARNIFLMGAALALIVATKMTPPPLMDTLLLALPALLLLQITMNASNLAVVVRDGSRAISAS